MVLEELLAIKDAELGKRKKFTLRCCLAAGCASSRSEPLKAALERAVADAGLADDVEVRGVGCMRLCCEGPLVAIDPIGVLLEEG